jgi:hypothetical protein
LNKLFKFKDFLTVAQAAQHLSTIGTEDVTEADVLRLVLDGRLQLSVRFVNFAMARIGKITPIADAEYEMGPSPDGTGTVRLYGWPVLYGSDGLAVSVVKLEPAVIRLTGVHDLPMIGNERLDIENAYQNLTGGPAFTIYGLDGTFVKRSDGLLLQLQENFDDIEIKKIGAKKRKKLLDQYEENRKIFQQDVDQKNKIDNYYPAGSLPRDSELVVRTDALQEFEQLINGKTVKSEKPLSTTERHTHQVMIAALCKKAGINHQDRGAASAIARLTDEIEVGVTDDTILKILKQIPDALAARGR